MTITWIAQENVHSSQGSLFFPIKLSVQKLEFPIYDIGGKYMEPTIFPILYSSFIAISCSVSVTNVHKLHRENAL